MATIEQATVNERIQNGYKFDFGKYISDGFEIFKKEWLMFSLYGLASVILMVASFATLVGALFFIFPLYLGFSVAAVKVENGEKLEFKDFFGAFKNYDKYVLLAVCYFAVFLVLYLPFIFLFVFMDLGVEYFDSNISGGFMGIFMMLYYVFFYAAIYFIQGSMIFTPYLIHYGNYSVVEAMKTSFKLFRKQILMILLFVFVVGMLSGIGYLACLIGIFATMAAGMLMQHAMVKDILMQSSYSEIDQIGNPEI